LVNLSDSIVPPAIRPTAPRKRDGTPALTSHGVFSLFLTFMSLRGTTLSAGASAHGLSVVASVIVSISVAVVVTRAPQGA